MPESGVTWSLKERRRQCTPVVGPPSAASPARTHRLARSVQHGDAPRWDRSGQSDRCPRRPLRSAQRGQLHRWVPPVPSHQLHPCFPPVPLRRSRQWLPPPPCARLPQSRRLPRSDPSLPSLPSHPCVRLRLSHQSRRLPQSDTGTRGFCAAQCRCIADEVLAGSHVLAGHMPTFSL
jgi:hypothetical protein